MKYVVCLVCRVSTYPENLGSVGLLPAELRGRVCLFLFFFVCFFTAARPAYAGTEGCFGLLVFFLSFLPARRIALAGNSHRIVSVWLSVWMSVTAGIV